MEKAASLSNYSPDSHCAFCLRVLRSSDRWRPVSTEDGLIFIGGQVSFLEPPKFIGAKFACDGCFGRNLAQVKVRDLLVTTHYHALVRLLFLKCVVICILHCQFLSLFVD